MLIDQNVAMYVQYGLAALFAAAMCWLVASFLWHVFNACRGRVNTSIYLPQILKTLAVALAGILLSSKGSVVSATVAPTTARAVVADKSATSSTNTVLGVALGGSAIANVALGAYALARRRQALRATSFTQATAPTPNEEQREISAQVATPDESWLVLVRVLGTPLVQTRDGRSVQFGKGKALELLTWMTEHRESSTRSAARTALWSENVQDSTFANVVSDIRRSLNVVIETPDESEWVPRTFTDRMPLHDAIITDAQLLAFRLKQFMNRSSSETRTELQDALAYVRDLPFAGANYAWADAEGITTTHVITAVQAAVVLAQDAMNRGDTSLLFSASEKGLRVLPGHEELVALRMKGHSRLGNRAAIKLEWESYARSVEADAWAGGEPSQALRELATTLSRV